MNLFLHSDFFINRKKADGSFIEKNYINLAIFFYINFIHLHKLALNLLVCRNCSMELEIILELKNVCVHIFIIPAC